MDQNLPSSSSSSSSSSIHSLRRTKQKTQQEDWKSSLCIRLKARTREKRSRGNTLTLEGVFTLPYHSLFSMMMVMMRMMMMMMMMMMIYGDDLQIYYNQGE